MAGSNCQKWTLICRNRSRNLRILFRLLFGLGFIVLCVFISSYSGTLSNKLRGVYFADNQGKIVSDGDHSTLHKRSPFIRERSQNKADNDVSPKSSHADDVTSGETFQQINQQQAWVYSAYIDVVNAKISLIRIFAIISLSLTQQAYCLVEEGGRVTVIKGVYRPLFDHRSMRFYSGNFECNLQPHKKPDYVAVTFNTTQQPNNRLRVVYPGSILRNFTVCHPALFNFKNPGQIIQAIEFNRILGAEHFFVYNYTISKATDAVLRHYQDLGLLTVLQWPLPTTEIWYYAQMAAVNDCVYRNRNVSRYVAIQDTDEFIIPKRHNSWNDVIRSIEANHSRSQNSNGNLTAAEKKEIGSFIFECTFFYNITPPSFWAEVKKNFSITNEVEGFLKKYSVIPFLHVQRLNKTFTLRSRTKTIVRPELIVQAGIHGTFYHKPGAEYTLVKSDLALVHHYNKIAKSGLYETSALRFTHQVYPRLKSAFANLSAVF
ncbi:beta-1,4-galactosyltransferase galt-1-like [Physella acuta]|uniref:beta-1,4-galactosyltransferase galt-1-like n=1 Tax=Physella acuta TaxID=109671 RepID=UPI0027DD3F01|nr:beta-1,4-galactosyltransferase galt-1-like [Physella acuta]